MAFMLPVMKNNYDIYKDGRSRKTSECSSASSNAAATALASALGTPTSSAGRRRKVSECKSESFATSPSHCVGAGGGGAGTGHGANGAGYRMQMQRCQSSRTFTRNTSRSSQHSAMMMSPTRSFCQTGSSPPKAIAKADLLKSTGGSGSGGGVTSADAQNDFTKFHMRLVDKLRKSFRKDSAKRS